MTPLLKVDNVSKIFFRRGQENFKAIDGVNFSLYRREILGIVGESGSGKSTVAKSIMRLIDISSGQILLNGVNIENTRGTAKRKLYRDVQMVFQNPIGSFDPRRTLGHGISEALHNIGFKSKEAKVRTEELLQQCGLSKDFAGRYPFEVSGGQCQRAAIARALAVNPKILICDEATSALDVTIQAQIVDLLKRLKDELDMSYLFISHDIALVQSFCDRLLVMHEGKIIETGTPDEVIISPRSEYTKKLVESVF